MHENTIIYEVNLTIEIETFNNHKHWLIEHFHDMVVINNFNKLNLFFEKNVNPIDDNHLRYQKISAQYQINDYAILQNYFDKQAKQMRSEVFERLKNHYTVSRRVLFLSESYSANGDSHEHI